jgi:hypothetical protein
MTSTQTSRWTLAASGLLAVIALTGCDTTHALPTAVETQLSTSEINLLIANTSIVTGSVAGDFVNAVIPNNSGRLTTEFWDNPSADNPTNSTKCNIGFYAAGTMAPNCVNQATGSNANQGGYTTYFGDGGSKRDPSAFMFDGSRSYAVTLIGSYSGARSTVGWFIKSRRGVYTFFPIAAWTNKAINSSITITPAMTGGRDWGFYINNDLNAATGGCSSDTHDCSDAEGGFSSVQFQQFALFSTRRERKLMVGAEDNRLEVGGAPPNYLDSDYNDYIWSIVPGKKSENDDDDEDDDDGRCRNPRHNHYSEGRKN